MGRTLALGHRHPARGPPVQRQEAGAHRVLSGGVFTRWSVRYHGTSGLGDGHRAGAGLVCSPRPDGKTKPYYMTARFTPDGKRLIAFEEHGIGVLDIAAGKEISRPIRVELNNAWLSVVSPDGRLVATGNYVPLSACESGNPRQRKADLTVRVYELASGKQVAALVGHTDEITGLAFSPDSRTIATAAGNFWHRKDRTVRVWDAATGRALHVFDNPDGADSLEYLPDGRRVVTVGMDGVATVWDVSVP